MKPMSCKELREVITNNDAQDVPYDTTLRIAIHYKACSACRGWLRLTAAVLRLQLPEEMAERSETEARRLVNEFLEKYHRRN